MQQHILNRLARIENGYSVCGLIDRRPIRPNAAALETTWPNPARP